MEIREVVAAGPGWTQVRASDGNTYTLSGTRNWRNNNPGNIEYGDFARSKGAVGTDGRFAVFPSYDTGRAAQSGLLFDNPKYAGKSISGAINLYAPPIENNTSGYYGRVSRDIGVPSDTPLSSLDQNQRSSMLDSMQRVEGYRAGKVTDAFGKPVSVGLLTSPQAQSAYGIMNVINPATTSPVQRSPLLDATPNMSIASQYAAYGQGQKAAHDAALLSADVAGLDPGYADRLKAQDIEYANSPVSPSTPAGIAAKETLKAGLLAQQPQADPTTTAGIVQAPAATQPARAATASPQDMARAGILAAGPVTPDYALGQRVERELSNRKMAGSLLGGLLGGLTLGPVGGLLGGFVGNRAAAKTYYPEAPKTDESKRGDGSLTNYGRSVANSSGQFSRALSSGSSGLW